MNNIEEQGEAGSFFGSESEQGQESQHVVEQGPGVGAADSVNNGAQSPRVPRSQISRAHPGQTTGFTERTSAVLSVLSGDDETALSAAEAAGEHTSHPNGTLATVLPKRAATGAALVLPSSKQQRRQVQAAIANFLAEDHLSPPESTSPIYRANSVVSHTAAPFKATSGRRHAETPISAPTLPGALVGASPTTSRVEFSRFPFGLGHNSVRSHMPQQQQDAHVSQQQQQQQQQNHHHLSHAPAGPSYVSMSVLPRPMSPLHTAPLPSTVGVVTGVPPTPVFLPPPAAGPSAAMPVSTQPQPANLAAWVGLAASMGVPLEMLQAQSSVLQAGQQAGQQAPLQQAEALQSMAAALQAQASVILQQQQRQAAQGRVQRPGADLAQAASSAPLPFLLPLTALRRQELPQNAVIEASGPGGSMCSIPDLVGASEVQGHPLPPPLQTHTAGIAAPAPLALTLASGAIVPMAAAVEVGGGGTSPPPPQQTMDRGAGSSHREGSGNWGCASPAGARGRGARGARERQRSAPAQASSQVHGHDRPPRAARMAAQAGPATTLEPAGPAGQHSHRGGGNPEAGHGIPSTDAAAIGGVVGDEAGNDGMEVQQAARGSAPDRQGVKEAEDAQQQQQKTAQYAQQEAALSPAALPPAPHGAASVMATLVSPGQQSDVESEISAPHSHPAHGHLHSPQPSMQPALATANAHMSLSYMAATASQPSHRQQAQQEHSAQGQSPQAQGAAGSRLATVETGGMEDDAAGGSVDMTTRQLGEVPQQQRATSAPPQHTPDQQRSPDRQGGGVGRAQGQRAPGSAAHRCHPTASAPTVLPGQEAGQGWQRPATSASLSAHCDDAGATGDFAEHNPCPPPAQSSAFVFRRQQRTSGWGEHTSSPQDLPLHGEGQGAAMGEGGAGPHAGQHQRGSPQGSMFQPAPAASQGTARGTILAGQAHSILTTAAAGDGQQGGGDEEGEALSPLVVGRLVPPGGPANGKPAGSHAGSPAPEPRHACEQPGTGQEVPHPQGRCAGATPPAGYGPRQAHCEPPDLSTIAQDVGGQGVAPSDQRPEQAAHPSPPDPTLLSGQPASVAATATRSGSHRCGRARRQRGSPPSCSVGWGQDSAREESVRANGEEREGEGAEQGEGCSGEPCRGQGYASSMVRGDAREHHSVENGQGGGAQQGLAAVGSEMTSPSPAAPPAMLVPAKKGAHSMAKRRRTGGSG